MTKNKTAFLMVFLGLILAACGNKGDLYVPKEEPSKQKQTEQKNQ